MSVPKERLRVNSSVRTQTAVSSVHASKAILSTRTTSRVPLVSSLTRTFTINSNDKIAACFTLMVIALIATFNIS